MNDVEMNDVETCVYIYIYTCAIWFGTRKLSKARSYKSSTKKKPANSYEVYIMDLLVVLRKNPRLFGGGFLLHGDISRHAFIQQGL